MLIFMTGAPFLARSLREKWASPPLPHPFSPTRTSHFAPIRSRPQSQPLGELTGEERSATKPGISWASGRGAPEPWRRKKRSDDRSHGEGAAPLPSCHPPPSTPCCFALRASIFGPISTCWRNTHTKSAER
jgi:hypothetical protein